MGHTTNKMPTILERNRHVRGNILRGRMDIKLDMEEKVTRMHYIHI